MSVIELQPVKPLTADAQLEKLLYLITRTNLTLLEHLLIHTQGAMPFAAPLREVQNLKEKALRAQHDIATVLPENNPL